MTDHPDIDAVDISSIIIGATLHGGIIYLQPFFPTPAAPDGHGLPIGTVSADDPTSIGLAIIRTAAGAIRTTTEESNRQLLSVSGHKTMKKLMMASRNIVIDGRLGFITYSPTRFAGIRHGFLFIDGPQKSHRVDPEEIGHRTLEAFTMCR